jgi:cytochrome c oxidase cbb3-type subunit 3
MPMLMVLMLMAAAQLPDAPGRATVQKVCGACHGMDVIVSKGRGREEWEQVIGSMVSKGAKASDAELGQVLDYLAVNLPPKPVEAAANTPQAPVRRKGIGAGSNDAHVVDEVSAARGRSIYAAECLACHGPKTRGTDKGPDLVRSPLVLHDRYGSTIGPLLMKGHPLQSGGKSAALTQAQVEDISNFLHESLGDTMRSGPYNKVLNVMTGDAQAGQAYFNGAGKCSGCHSATGDLAGVAGKFDAPGLQQRFLFPQRTGFSAGHVMSAKVVTVTVTPGDGGPVTGTLVSADDFSVALRDEQGAYHSWKRTPELKMVEHDPYQGHEELLDQYTDKDIHNVLAYLETLK